MSLKATTLPCPGGNLVELKLLTLPINGRGSPLHSPLLVMWMLASHLDQGSLLVSRKICDIRLTELLCGLSARHMNTNRVQFLLPWCFVSGFSFLPECLFCSRFLLWVEAPLLSTSSFISPFS